MDNAFVSLLFDAVRCASEIQKSCSEIYDMKLRIGIHLGEVVFENNIAIGSKSLGKMYKNSVSFS
jgi:class 3 adenylate cyclase